MNLNDHLQTLGRLASNIPYLVIEPSQGGILQLLSLDESRLAVTIDELVSQTVRRTKDAARNCTSVENRRSPALVKRNPLLWTYRSTCREASSDSNGHVQHFSILLEFDSRGKKGKMKLKEMEGKPVTDFHVGVRCTCPAFVYWVSEYNSYEDGYDLGKTPRGEIVPPTINLKFKNGESTARSYLCKHLISAAKHWSRKKVEVPK